MSGVHLVPGWCFLHVLSNKGGIGHAHQRVGQWYHRQEVLCGDSPGNTICPLSHNVAQSQFQTSSQGQLLQQRLLGKRTKALGVTEYTVGELQINKLKNTFFLMFLKLYATSFWSLENTTKLFNVLLICNLCYHFKYFNITKVWHILIIKQDRKMLLP